MQRGSARGAVDEPAAARIRRYAIPFLLAFVATGAGGCAMIGPQSIRNGRAAYNDAIISTNNQQVLAMIVRMRYGEPTGLLAVSSVTANLNVAANIGSELGVNSDADFEGTPLTAGIGFEENPTISYVPVQGEAYLRQLLSPLPIDLTVLVLGALANSPQALTILVRSVNGLRNPEVLSDRSVEIDPRFGRLAGILAALARSGGASWVQAPEKPSSFALALWGKGETFEQLVRELYEVLDFPPPRDLENVVTLPVRLGIGRPRSVAMQLQTRSLFDVFQNAAATVEVPEEDVASGLAPRLPPSGATGGAIRIRGADKCPRTAMVAYKHHGHCYFIDGTDTASKLAFRLVEALLSVRMAESVGSRATPVLTVPVSR